MLKLEHYTVEVEGQEVLCDVSLDFELGKNYCILGKNGSGKSSLAMSLMGHPKYSISLNNQTHVVINNEAMYMDQETKSLLHEKGAEDFDNIDVLSLDASVRAKIGIFVAFQHIPEIPGLKLFEFLRTIYNARWSSNETFLSFKKIVEPLCEELGIVRDFLWRDLNVGFSGGERRKIEILQLALLKPRYIFLDEVDSGLDVDAFKSVASLLASYNNETNCLIIITHYFDILEYVPINHVYLLDEGQLVAQGDMTLVQRVKEHGFAYPNDNGGQI